MTTIFIIDDDEAIGNMEQTVLEKNGYSCVRAYSGTEAVMRISNGLKPDLILLDLMLPGLNGEDVLSKIKAIMSTVPVIVVSAKIDIDSRVNMLTEGAIDYLTKPFDTRELLARIELRLKGTVKPSSLHYNDIVLDSDSYSVTVAGKYVSLTKTEFAILKILMKNPESVVTKSNLLDSLAEYTEDCTEGSLKTHISHLRSKLKAVSGKDYIEAIWGIGFKLK